MENYIKIFCDNYYVSYENAMKLLEYANSIKIKKNEFVIKQDTVNDNIFVVKEGLLRGIRFNKKHETTLWFTSIGQAFFCPKLFANEKKSAICVQAISDCTLYYMSKKEINNLNRTYPILKPIYINIFTELIVDMIKFRLIIIDNDNANDRFLNFRKIRPDICNKIPLKYISSYLGITQQSLSKIKTSLKKTKTL